MTPSDLALNTLQPNKNSIDTLVTVCQSCARAKSVRRLPQELHLILFPQAQSRRGARVAKVKCTYENEKQN
jgi:hypothetical protein